MITRSCRHCEAEIEVPLDGRVTCPICGLDPDLPQFGYAFEDAHVFFLGGDPRLEPVPIEVPVSLVG
jgi:hypothetical protein